MAIFLPSAHSGVTHKLWDLQNSPISLVQFGLHMVVILKIRKFYKNSIVFVLFAPLLMYLAMNLNEIGP